MTRKAHLTLEVVVRFPSRSVTCEYDVFRGTEEVPQALTHVIAAVAFVYHFCMLYHYLFIYFSAFFFYLLLLLLSLTGEVGCLYCDADVCLIHSHNRSCASPHCMYIFFFMTSRLTNITRKKWERRLSPKTAILIMKPEGNCCKLYKFFLRCTWKSSLTQDYKTKLREKKKSRRAC